MKPELEKFAREIWPEAPGGPLKTLRCRGCGRSNRVPVPVAILDPEACECGACGTALFLGRDEPLEGLSARAYEHSLDRTSLDALQAVPGFAALTRWVMANVADRGLRLLQMSSAVRCGDDQFPELAALMEQARNRLGVTRRPVLFLSESPSMNARAGGVEAPTVVVQSALLDQLSDPAVVAVFGHELGHLHSEHGLHRVLADVLVTGGSFFGGLGSLATLPIRKALLKWWRCAELSADRAGLLASRDLKASLEVFLAFAGGNRPGTRGRTRMSLGPYVRQARELAELEANDWLDGALAAWMTLDMTHPFTAWRVMHLLDWVEKGNCLEILAGRYERAKSTQAA